MTTTQIRWTSDNAKLPTFTTHQGQWTVRIVPCAGRGWELRVTYPHGHTTRWPEYHEGIGNSVSSCKAAARRFLDTR